MRHNIEISVVIPAYQEVENLKILLPTVIEILDKLKVSYEIIVVDTITPLDDTQILCHQLNVTCIPRSPTNDFGDAVRSGIKTSVGRYIVFMDGDGSHDPQLISTLYQYVNKYDVIIASRYVSGGATKNPKILIWMSWILNKTYSLVLGIPVQDISNSFKLYPGDLLRSLNLVSIDFNIIQEILFKLHQKNNKLHIKEVPFTFEQRQYGQSKRKLTSFIISYLFSLLKMRLMSLFSRKYPHS